MNAARQEGIESDRQIGRLPIVAAPDTASHNGSEQSVEVMTDSDPRSVAER